MLKSKQRSNSGWMRVSVTTLMLGALVVATTAPKQISATEAVTCATSLAACDLALKATEAELALRKEQYERLQQYAQMTEAQRDRAYKAAEPGAGLPWYVWVIVGAAAGVVLVRGFR